MATSSEGAFTTEGFKPFPSVHSDNQIIGGCSEWSDQIIEEKITEYWLFLERDDIQPRARGLAQRVLAHLGFEIDYRAGCYVDNEMEALSGTV